MTHVESIYGLTVEELTERITALGEPAFRARQVFAWLYAKLVSGPAAMTNLPAALRETLAESFSWKLPEIDRRENSADGTSKYRLRLDDGEAIECVSMPAEEGGGASFCISSQAGCALGCVFCMTGGMGMRRDLEVDEIVAQVVLMLREMKLRPTAFNILFMGMGEPLLNLDAVGRAIEIFSSDKGLGVVPRRIFVSTAGIPEGIERLCSGERRPRLAISLNAPDQALREKLMPIAKRHPLPELMKTLRSLPAVRDMITIEYVLLAGVNDSPAHAGKLARLLRGMHAKVNVIPFNPCEGLPFGEPGEKAVEAFLATLSKAGVRCTVRRSRGRDLSAACGQLAVET